MRGDERRIYFYDLNLKTNKSRLPPPPIRDWIVGLNSAYTNSLANLETNKGSKLLLIKEVLQDGDFTIFYLICADKSAPDVRFTDPLTGTSRMGMKLKTEYRDFGAHFIVKNTPVEPNTYLCVLEKNTGLSRSMVSRLLQASLRNFYSHSETAFSMPEPNGARLANGTPKLVNYKPMGELTGHPSASFIAQMNSGKLLDITLIHSKGQTPAGGAAWLTQEETTLRLKPDKIITQGMADKWNPLKTYLRLQAPTYENARVKFQSPESGKPESVMISSLDGSIVDDRFVKSKIITGLYPPLPECSEGIDLDFARKMIRLM